MHSIHLKNFFKKLNIVLVIIMIIKEIIIICLFTPSLKLCQKKKGRKADRSE